MEKSIVPIKESGHISDSMTSASKSVGSLVQINSIAIDLTNAMEEIESPAIHQHFSIRGFVAEMRKKNPKVCSTFASEGDVCDKGHNLPPLYVPSFRWWQCSNCSPDISSQRSTLEMVVAGGGQAGTSSCPNVDGKKDSSSLQENIGYKHDLGKYGDGEDNYSVNVINNSQICWNEGQKAMMSSKDESGGNPCADMTEVIQDIRKRTNATADASDVLPEAEGPSCRFVEPENASSGRDGTSSTLPHRRKRKLRSLADIMVEERKPVSEHSRPRSASSNGIQSISTETEAILGPQLQLVVPKDIAKGIKSPPTKRKISPEEDEGTSGTTYLSGPTKKFRGLVLQADKICRSVENSVTESEGNAYAPLDLQFGLKTQRLKNKKSKATDISREPRQIPVDKGKAPMKDSPKINSPSTTNLQKHAIGSESNFGNLGHDPSTLREMRPYFMSSLAGQDMERMSTMTKSKSSEVEASHNHLKPPRKSTIGDRNNKGKAALDLSLNSFTNNERKSRNPSFFRPKRGIPDLNETFRHKTAQMRGKQLGVCSEKGSSSLHKNLDISASCTKEALKEGKRPLDDPEQPILWKTDNNIEQRGASEDIPMDIVELLAKNQFERKLGNFRKNHQPIRGSPAPYGDDRPGLVSFPSANARSGVTMENGHMGATLPQPNKNHLVRDKIEESQFRLFSSYIPYQQRKTQYSASSSILAGPSHTGGADLLWPPRRENLPVHVGASQNHNHFIQASSSFVPSLSDKCHKGKTISDIKDLEEKRAAARPSVLKEGRIGSNPTSVGSLDTYSNDTIPAMQLLSLMDQRILSGSTFKVGPKSFLDKNHSPYNHHPRLDGNGNQNFLDGSFLSHNNQPVNFPGLRYGASCSGKSKRLLQGQIPVEQGTSKGIHLDGTNGHAIRPARSELGVCTLNRNPADFSIPDAKNKFTISSKDLKPKKRNDLIGKSYSHNVVVQKKQKGGKDVSGKKQSRK